MPKQLYLEARSNILWYKNPVILTLTRYELMAAALELHMLCEFETFEAQIYLAML